jgi:glycosyltransferase involved in cell wall biosynthesis
VKGGIAERSAIEASRDAILAEIAESPDLVLVRGLGNRGDELIWEGTRRLLSPRIHREIGLDGLCSATGHTVLLSGSGALCRPHHDWMPRALAVAELRFERVVVLPSSIDPSEDAVREALSRTRATVFARERETYRRIRSLCDARLAHDCAFFFDFEPDRRPGCGVLNAFRTDAEARADRPVPPDNDDISLTAATLELWLERIATHELVRTDRAHVMIAAAMMGKRVEFAPGSYHKLEAIAAYALGDLPVRAIDEPRAHPVDGHAPRPGRDHPAPGGGVSDGRAPTTRVSAVVLTRDRPGLALRAIDSLRSNDTPLRALVIDNNSAPPGWAELAAGCAERDGVTARRSDRNLGCAGGRSLGAQRTAGELVLFLDDDAELEPGAVDLLVDELDAHPEAAAVTATVTFPDGTTHHSGGWMRISQAMAEFGLLGAGLPPDQVAPSGPADWVPGTASLIRRSTLERFPIETRMRAYFEDNEWCYRVERARPGSFRRSLEARAVHHFAPRRVQGDDFAARSGAIERLQTLAAFYALHRKLLVVDLFELVPELRGNSEEKVAAARLLMELLLAKGADWTFMEWMNGGLGRFLSAPTEARETRAEGAQLTARLEEAHGALAAAHEHSAQLEQEITALQVSHETLVRIEQGGWWRLRKAIVPALRLYWRLRGREAR